jgi:hypothetical protein
MTEIIWNRCVKNRKELHIFEKEINFLRRIKDKKAIWSGHILRRNCL